MSQTYLHAQPSTYGGLRQPSAKPFSWSKIDNDSLTTNTIYGRGETRENTTNAVKWNQAGNKLLAGGRDGTIRLYDTEGSIRHLQDYK